MDRVIPTSSGGKRTFGAKARVGTRVLNNTDPKQPTIKSFGVEEQIKQAVAELGQAKFN